MKILVTSVIDLERSAHNRLHQFLEYLAISNEVVVVSINDNWKEKNESNSINDDYNLDKLFKQIKIIHYSKKDIPPIVQEILSFVTIKKVLKEIDISSFDVHYNYNGLFGGYAIAKLLRKYGTPTVYDVADDLPAMIATSPQIPKILRPIGFFVGSRLFKKNIKISAKVTITTKDFGENCMIPSEKLVVLPNGVDIEMFQKKSNSITREMLDIGDELVIGYVGVLREWVDFEPLFSAVSNIILKSIKNIRIMIVGSGPYLEHIQNIADKYSIKGNIMFTGSVPYGDIPGYISTMDICVIPFKGDLVAKNSLPLKLFEYMACGKLVISSKIDVIVKEMSDYVLCAESDDEYETCIMKYVNEPMMIKSIVNNAREFTSKNYTWNAISKKLEDLLLGVKK